MYGLRVRIPNPRGHTPGPYPQSTGPHNACGLQPCLQSNNKSILTIPIAKGLHKQHNRTPYNIVTYLGIRSVGLLSYP